MYQRIVENILYPLYAAMRGSKELSLLRELRRSERLSPDELHEARLRKLKELLRHSARHVPFYSRRFADAGFEVEAVRDFADLQKIPILTKRVIQEHRDQLVSTAFARKELIENHTGGSTGAPLHFFHDRRHWDIRRACTLRHNLWAGHRIGSKVAVIWGQQSDLPRSGSLRARLRNTLVDRALFCNSSNMSEENLFQFVKDYQAFRPETIIAYANSLSLVVDFVKANSIELPSPQTIITSAEVLESDSREKIESFFGVKIFDRYGARETSVIASECPAHEGLHIGAEYLHLEIAEDNRPVSPGESGEILVTVLGNHAFPLIRYQIGDRASAAKEGTCSCGVTLPKMTMVAGRTTDFLIGADGRRVSGAALTINLVAKVRGIRQAQIVQSEFGRLLFKLVVGAEFDESSKATIESMVKSLFGNSMAVDYRFVELIPREASGKYRFSICELQTSGSV